LAGGGVTAIHLQTTLRKGIFRAFCPCFLSSFFAFLPFQSWWRTAAFQKGSRENRIPFKENGIPFKENHIPCDENRIPCNENGIPCDESRIPCNENGIPCDENRIPEAILPLFILK